MVEDMTYLVFDMIKICLIFHHGTIKLQRNQIKVINSNRKIVRFLTESLNNQ